MTSSTCASPASVSRIPIPKTAKSGCSKLGPALNPSAQPRAFSAESRLPRPSWPRRCEAERERPRRVVRAERRDLEREPEGVDLAHRLDVEPCRQAPFRVERRGDAQALGVASRRRREPLPDPVLQRVERLAADDRELHQVGRVVALVEVDQLVPDVGAGTVREGRRVPAQEARERMAGIEGLLPCSQAPEPVVAPPRDVLGVHHMALAIDVLGIEPGRDEELGEPVERAFEMRGVDIEEIVRMGERGRGIGGAAVLGDETVVLAGVRILPGAEKQHVFEEVREARARFRIVGAPHVDVERRRGLVGVRIGDEERFESVVEQERTVVPGVGGAALDLGAVRRRGCGHGRRRGEQDGERRREEVKEEAASHDPRAGAGFRPQGRSGSRYGQGGQGRAALAGAAPTCALSHAAHGGGPLRRLPAPCRRDTSGNRGRCRRPGSRRPRCRYAPRARAPRREARRPPP